MEADTEFLAAETRYREHMQRFLAAHPAGSGINDALRELERRERWQKIMGGVAFILEPPRLGDLEATTVP